MNGGVWFVGLLKENLEGGRGVDCLKLMSDWGMMG